MVKLISNPTASIVMSVVWILVIASFANLHHARKLDPAKLASYTVQELIDGLRDEASEGLGTHSTAWADGFLASDDEPRFRGGIIGSIRPTSSPVIRELVRRGVKGLPDLLDHLTDRRSTRLVVKLPFPHFGAMWHSDEYDPRYTEKTKQPRGVNVLDDKSTHLSQEYRMRVGDLCYVAVGQIVNRYLIVGA
jgi:hypothetical protein